MRYVYFDLETSDLAADIGRILCASFLNQDGKLWTLRNDKIGPNMADDEKIALQIRDTLEDYHLTIGWYSKGFDLSFLNSRLVKAGHKVLRPGLHLDPIWFCKGWRGIKARSSKLKIMAEFFDLPDELRKIHVDVDIWTKAALGGDKRAMDILVDRCEGDVLTTKVITEKILDADLVRNIQRYP